MKQRIITAIIALAFFVPVIIFADDVSFRICLSIVSALSAIELLQCTGTIKKSLLSVPLVLFALCMPLSYNLHDNVRWVIVVAVMFYCMSTMVLSNGNVTSADVGTAYTGVLFCTFSYDCIAVLREDYSWAFLLIFIAAWGSDTFAYFAGRAFGRHKLIPKISPKKTIEGAVGGAIAGMILFPVFGLVLSCVTDCGVNYILLSVLGLIAALVSQLGDLIMSAIKRNYDIKDFGNLFPGHGGFLDRFDSTLTVAPLLCLAFGVFKIIY